MNTVYKVLWCPAKADVKVLREEGKPGKKITALKEASIEKRYMK